AYDKIYRKARERLAGKLWRLRSNHAPLDGLLGPDQWRPGEILEDRYPFYVPANAAPGLYQVRVKMVRPPPYLNWRLVDYCRDEDLLDGPVVGTVTVSGSPTPRPRGPGAEAAEVVQ